MAQALFFFSWKLVVKKRVAGIEPIFGATPAPYQLVPLHRRCCSHVSFSSAGLQSPPCFARSAAEAGFAALLPPHIPLGLPKLDTLGRRRLGSRCSHAPWRASTMPLTPCGAGPRGACSTSSLCPGAGASSQGIRENFPAAARAARPPLTQTAAREVPTILKHKERQQCCAKQEDLCMEPGCSRFPALPREREIGAGMGGTRFAQWCSDPGCCPRFAMQRRLFGADVGSSLLPGCGGSRGRAKCQSIALGRECG